MKHSDLWDALTKCQLMQWYFKITGVTADSGHI